MYRRAGYRVVSEQPAWQVFLEGREAPLLLMVRRLPRKAGTASSPAGAESEGSVGQQTSEGSAAAAHAAS
jgi:hypothetical protein